MRGFWENWRLGILNLLAVAILTVIAFHPGLDRVLDSGKWSLRFLLLCLAMTPLNTLFGWRSAVKLRKPLGLWAFAFGVLHFAFYVLAWGSFDFLKPPVASYIFLGIGTLSILSALAVTSNRWAMKRLGKNWKRLHRLVYLAGGVAVVHALLATTMGKKVLIRDPNAQQELAVYLFVLVILLALRIPVIRSAAGSLKRLRIARLKQA